MYAGGDSHKTGLSVYSVLAFMKKTKPWKSMIYKYKIKDKSKRKQ